MDSNKVDKPEFPSFLSLNVVSSHGGYFYSIYASLLSLYLLTKLL
jgi:hypothetical protein